MSLTNIYTMSYGHLADFFTKIKEGQAPSQFTQQLLKDLGFASSNHRAFIPLLKELGFLSPDGAPTSRYHEYRDHSRSTAVMAEAIKEAYSDIFLIKQYPTTADRLVVQGKFKSSHNVSDNVAKHMASTFFALLALADLKTIGTPSESKVSGKVSSQKASAQIEEIPKEAPVAKSSLKVPGLHYNIQIHLPATKDIEVYNAIFKSLKEHLFEA